MNQAIETHRQPPAEFPPSPAEDEFNPIDLLHKLNRRKFVIAGIFILVMALGMLYLSRQVPQYTATAKLMFNTRQNQVVDVGAVLSGLPTSASAMETIINSEIDIIKSGPFLGRVADQLNLTRDSLFNPDLRPVPEKGVIDEIHDWFMGLITNQTDDENHGEHIPDAAEDPQLRAARIKKTITDTIARGLTPQHVRSSFTLNLSFTFTDPGRATEVVNAIADAYLMDQLEAKFEATRRANEWLSDRLDTLRQEVHTAELAVQKVREQGNMLRAGGTTLLEQQIAEINAQLVIARVNRSQGEARLDWVRDNMERDPVNALKTMADSSTSTEIQRLRSEETQLRRKESELSGRYGPRHPEMLKIKAEITDLREKIQEEAQRLITALANEVEISKAKERGLLQSLEALKSQTSKSLQTEVEMAELERQAEVARTLYENFLTRFRETRDQEDLHRPDARIINYADIPEKPSYPDKKRVLGLSAILGLMLGIMGAFFIEAMDRGFRQNEQVEQATGLSVLGMVPLHRKSKTKPVDYVIAKPLSQLAEAIRGIRAAIQLSNVDQPPKTILVASSLPKEGKSTFSALLGRVSAMSGSKILLIDGDLRRPRLAKMLNFKPEVWLEDVVAGEESLPSAILTDPKTGLHVLCGNGKSPNASDLLGSRRMQNIIQTAAKTYDMVIIDTPPLMGVSDAWTLAQSVDQLIFIIRWADTPRETVRAAMRQMEMLNLPAKGIVLSQVDTRKQAYYGYGNYGYYYKRYQQYYKE